MALANPFDDLDNVMIASLFSLLEAPDAVELARANRRLFDIHSNSRTNRPFRRYDIVIMDFTQNHTVPWRIRLGNRAISKPKKPLFVHIVEKPLEEPDFQISVATPFTNIFVKLDKFQPHAYRRYFSPKPEWMSKIKFKEPPSTLKCHVKVGDDRYGMIALFKFLQQRFALDQLFVDEADAEILNYLALYPLPLVQHLQIFPKITSTEDAVLRLVQEMPHLQSLAVRGPFSSFPPDFYNEPAILNLPTFICFGGTCDADFTQVKWRNFVRLNGRRMTSSITVKGIQVLLEEWKTDSRKIDFWFFHFDVGRLDLLVAASRILEGSFDQKSDDDTETGLQFCSGVVRSKSGKELFVEVSEDARTDPTIMLASIPWEEHWAHYLRTFRGLYEKRYW